MRRMKEELADDPLWYKDAVIYQLHVKSFFDSNGDGIGDFAGLLSRLDYIVSLGATAVWLLPFYPSPRRDDGYDISDYLGVLPEYGAMQDVRRLVAEAHARGLRVITELVINHTSDQHPWFQRARAASKGTVTRDFYVWSDTDAKYAGTRIIFSDTEKSNWAWDDVAKAFYWHRFYSHQPDLNYDNPALLRAILRVMRFWLELGIDGLRLDAVPYLVEREGTSNENLPETHRIVKLIRAEMDAHFPGRMLLAEANQWPEDVQQYFGDGDECHMAFHFPLMPRMYMAIAQEDRFPITDIMRQTPEIPANCQWAIFLRNHDELTLEMVTDSERDYLWEVYAADRRARINLGIRRRLAPLMERDRRRIELMNSLLLTMPGTPVIYYGDEIGMGDNIYLGDRDGVRTPMQWSSDRNGGFSKADPAQLVLPPIMDPVYGYQAVNVEAQERDPHSLLSWLRRMLVVRREHKAFGRGTLRFLQPSNRKVFVYLREWQDDKILCIANLSRTAQAVELDLREFAGFVPIELTGRSAFPAVAADGSYLLTLQPYGFFSFLLCPETQQVRAPAPGDPMPDLLTFVLRGGIADVVARDRAMLERDVLPAYLPRVRWFQGKDAAVGRAAVKLATPFPPGAPDRLLTVIETAAGQGAAEYMLPLAVVWEDAAVPSNPVAVVARVRHGRRVGFLVDAGLTPDFMRALLGHLQRGDRLPMDGAELAFRPSPRFDELGLGQDAAFEWMGTEQSNTSVVVERKAVFKLLRRVVAGAHPEAEMTRVLTERNYPQIAAMFGDVVLRREDTDATIGILQSFVANQGDGWKWTQEYLNRTLNELLVTGMASQAEDALFSSYQAFSSVLGKRLGEMHAVLAQPTDDPDFVPETAGEADAARWRDDILAQIGRACDALWRLREWRNPADSQRAERLLERRNALERLVERHARVAQGSLRIRIHGDLHLGQLLVTGGDVVFIDFEGEPLKSLAERRAKSSPYRDVAGMLRSFDYAAAMVEKSLRASGGPYTAAEPQHILRRFVEVASACFLQAYAQAAPQDFAASRDILDMFTIEKAAYEIAYEAANRPDWIDVPLRGLADLVGRLMPEEPVA